jgi:hypothetical protein
MELDQNGASDIGKSNLAFAFASLDGETVRKQYLINLAVYGTDKLELGPIDYGRIIHYWVNYFKDEFMRTKDFGIEQQPQFVGRSEMHIIQAHLESAIRCTYPHINVVLLDPKKMRKWLGTSGGDYKTRKNKSVCSGVFSEHDVARMKKAFRKNQYSTKTKKWTVKSKIDDVIEASIMALYLCRHPDTLNPPIKVVFENTEEPSVHMMENIPVVGGPACMEEEATPKKKRKKASSSSSEPKRHKSEA